MQIKIGEGRKMDYLLLILGFILLIKGADYFVDGQFQRGKALEGAIDYYRAYGSGIWDKHAGTVGQRDSGHQGK